MLRCDSYETVGKQSKINRDISQQPLHSQSIAIKQLKPNLTNADTLISKGNITTAADTQHETTLTTPLPNDSLP